MWLRYPYQILQLQLSGEVVLMMVQRLCMHFSRIGSAVVSGHLQVRMDASAMPCMWHTSALQHASTLHMQ